MGGGTVLFTGTCAALLALNFMNQQGKRAAAERRPRPPQGPLFTDTSFLPPPPPAPKE